MPSRSFVRASSLASPEISRRVEYRPSSSSSSSSSWETLLPVLSARIRYTRCTLRRHYTRFVCLVTFLPFCVLPSDRRSRARRLPPLSLRGLLPGVGFFLSFFLCLCLCAVPVAWKIRAGDRNSNASRIMGRFRFRNVEWKFSFRRILLRGRMIIFGGTERD